MHFSEWLILTDSIAHLNQLHEAIGKTKNIDATEAVSDKTRPNVTFIKMMAGDSLNFIR